MSDTSLAGQHELAEYVDGLPNLSGAETLIAGSIADAAERAVFAPPGSGDPFAGIDSAFAIACTGSCSLRAARSRSASGSRSPLLGGLVPDVPREGPQARLCRVRRRDHSSRPCPRAAIPIMMSMCTSRSPGQSRRACAV